MPGPRTRHAALASLLFALALAARLPGITYGLPAIYAPDEYKKVLAVAGLDDPDSPRPTQQPAFLINSTWVLLRVVEPLRPAITERLALHGPGVGPRLAFDILVGRVWMAVISAATAAAVYWLALRVHSGRAAEIAGALYAAAPLAVATGQYLKEDTPVTLFITLAAIAATAIVRTGSWRAYALAALACGAATGAKYIGAMSLGAVLIAHFLCPAPHSRLAAVPPAFLLGLLASSPQSAVHFTTMISAMGVQTEYLATGHHDGVAVSPWQHWFTFYLRRALAPGIGLAALLAAAAGVAFLAKNRSRPGCVLIAGIAFYYLAAEFMPAKPYPFFARYMLPILPLVAVTAGVGVLETAWRLSRPSGWRRNLPASLAALVLIQPLVITLSAARRALPDTRDLATAWIEANIPPGTQIGIPPGFAANTYVPVLPPGMTYDRMDVGDLRRFAPRPGGVWVLLSAPAVERYLEHPAVRPDIVDFVQTVARTGPQAVEFRQRTRLGFHNPTIRLYHLTAPPP